MGSSSSQPDAAHHVGSWIDTKVETFPPTLVARMFNFVKPEPFESEDPTVGAAPEVRF